MWHIHWLQLEVHQFGGFNALFTRGNFTVTHSDVDFTLYTLVILVPDRSLAQNICSWLLGTPQFNCNLALMFCRKNTCPQEQKVAHLLDHTDLCTHFTKRNTLFTVRETQIVTCVEVTKDPTVADLIEFQSLQTDSQTSHWKVLRMSNVIDPVA